MNVSDIRRNCNPQCDGLITQSSPKGAAVESCMRIVVKPNRVHVYHLPSVYIQANILTRAGFIFQMPFAYSVTVWSLEKAPA